MKKLLLSLLFSGFLYAHAAVIVTDVLVIGGTASGTSAAMQSARNKARTILVEPGPWLGGEMTSGAMCIVEGNSKLPTGIWGQFYHDVHTYYSHTPGYDTTAGKPLRFEPAVGAAILKKTADTTKNLTLKMNTAWTAVRRVGTGWEVSITEHGHSNIIQAQVLIDATPTGDVAAKAGVPFISGFDSREQTGEQLAPEKALPFTQDITWMIILKDYGAGTDHTIPKPEGYDAGKYDCQKGKDLLRMVKGGKLANDRYAIKWSECANSYPASVELLSPANREKYYQEIRQRNLCLVYYLQTTGGLKNFGLDDEFATADHMPPIPYMREDRRTVGNVRMTLNDIYTPYNTAEKLYRTSIAVGDASPGQHFVDGRGPKTNYPAFPGYSVPLGVVLVKGFDNLLVTEKSMSTTHLVNASTFYPSVQMAIGQGAGAVAAYCVLHKTNTEHLDVRAIQTQLLNAKAYLMPFADILPSDPNFRAIQQIGATGLLQGIQKPEGKTASVLFKPDSVVYTAEIKPVLEKMYPKSVAWFAQEKPGEHFTLGNFLSFIHPLIADGNVMRADIIKGQWKSKYHFKQPFSLDSPVTRREFALLVSDNLNPFGQPVDVNGAAK